MHLQKFSENVHHAKKQNDWKPDVLPQVSFPFCVPYDQVCQQQKNPVLKTAQ